MSLQPKKPPFVWDHEYHATIVSIEEGTLTLRPLERPAQLRDAGKRAT